jgi:hypothetical protein
MCSPVPTAPRNPNADVGDPDPRMGLWVTEGPIHAGRCLRRLAPASLAVATDGDRPDARATWAPPPLVGTSFACASMRV